MRITKQRPLPAAKGMPRHRYRNWHIDTNHANLDAPRKLMCGIAIGSEQRHAVAKFMGIDQAYCFSKIRYPNHA